MDLKIAITGSTGMIGSAISYWFSQNGCTVTPLIRPDSAQHSSDGILWDYQNNHIDLAALEGYDAIIHLAGANIANHRWTESYKKTILDSRVDSTYFLAQSIRQLRKPPKYFFTASAIGYYGDRPDGNFVDETCPRGQGYLAIVTQEWEEATQPAKTFGVNVVHMRFGIVLDRKSGALAKMLPPFYYGLGGPIGSGQQGMSWIALEEIPKIIYFLMEQKNISGPINFTSPNPVSNAEFSRILGEVIQRPAKLPLPSFAVQLLFGEMGKELLLSGAYVIPRRLLDLGYSFKNQDVDATLKSLLA